MSVEGLEALIATREPEDDQEVEKLDGDGETLTNNPAGSGRWLGWPPVLGIPLLLEYVSLELAKMESSPLLFVDLRPVSWVANSSYAHLSVMPRVSQRVQYGRVWSHRTFDCEHGVHAFFRGMVTLVGVFLGASIPVSEHVTTL